MSRDEQLWAVIEAIANADADETIGSLSVDVPAGGYPRQWLGRLAQSLWLERQQKGSAALTEPRLLADVELHLKSIRVFITSRQQSHPCGVDIHDELQAKVTAAIDAIGREKFNG